MKRKLINLHCITTNKLKYSYDIDMSVDENSKHFEEEYLSKVYKFFNVYNPNCYYYKITTKFIHDHTNSEKQSNTSQLKIISKQIIYLSEKCDIRQLIKLE